MVASRTSMKVQIAHLFLKHWESLAQLTRTFLLENSLNVLFDKINLITPSIQKAIDDLLFSCSLKASDGQVYRVAKRFALVAAASKLATAFGIAGWENGETS